MYVITVHTCLSILSYCYYYYVFFVCIFIFVTFLFFLLGNYLQFFNVNTSSNGSSNKVYSSYICVLNYHSTKSTDYTSSVGVDLNFNVTKSYCIAFTPKLYKLTLPSLHIINHLPILCTDSIKYLRYIFSSDNSDDAEKLRQMRLVYCRSNSLVRRINKCSQNVLIELCRSIYTTIYCPYF